MLEIENVDAGYGSGQVLFGVTLGVGKGQVVSLLGRNGAGKTTTLMTIMGRLVPRAGAIRLAGRPIAGRPPHEIARAGIGLVPEGRRVFPNLTVEENLIATARGQGWSQGRVLELFPILAERRRQLADRLSGGEQQMLAIGRALLTSPSLLLLDEPTEGLAPLLRKEIWQVIATLKREGIAILVVDKNLAALSRVADRHYLLEKGRIAWAGTTAELTASRAAVTERLTV